MEVTELVFELWAIKAKTKGVITSLTSYAVAMVTNDVKEITTTCLPIVGHLFDAIL